MFQHLASHLEPSCQSGPVIRSHGSLRERREAGSRLAGVVAQAELNGGRWAAGVLDQLVSVSQPRRRADRRRGLDEAVGAGLITIAGPFAGFASRGYCTWLGWPALYCIQVQVQVQVRAGVQPRPFSLAGSLSCLVLSCLV